MVCMYSASGPEAKARLCVGSAFPRIAKRPGRGGAEEQGPVGIDISSSPSWETC